MDLIGKNCNLKTYLLRAVNPFLISVGALQ